jgi:hypothetical protein
MTFGLTTSLRKIVNYVQNPTMILQTYKRGAVFTIHHFSNEPSKLVRVFLQSSVIKHYMLLVQLISYKQNAVL